MITIIEINKESAEINIIRSLFTEYAAELNENLCFQSFDEELRNPSKKYGSPAGSLLLAYYNNEPAGCVALQPLPEPEACEMKRLYVRQQYRKYKIGAELVKAILEEAAKKGYKKMVLDTLERLQPAIRLYEKFGFENAAAYYKNPLPNVVYMQKIL